MPNFVAAEGLLLARYISVVATRRRDDKQFITGFCRFRCNGKKRRSNRENERVPMPVFDGFRQPAIIEIMIVITRPRKLMLS